MSKKQKLTIYLSPDLITCLQGEALLKKRSITAQVDFIISQFFKTSTINTDSSTD